ncbi:MAG: hypothetical protein J6T87_10665 [Bacteroidales bacterium]|nr:hypothetical protein [Bacteroidales bacterium]
MLKFRFGISLIFDLCESEVPFGRKRVAPFALWQHLLRLHFHPAEREQLLSQVFEGRAEVIDGVVDDEEAVLVAVALANSNGRILPVLPFEVT